jgi:hypothetical protein
MIDSLLLRFSRWRYKERNYWMFIDPQSDIIEHQPILILKGPYGGVVYHYDVVSIDDQGKVRFNLKIINNSDNKLVKYGPNSNGVGEGLDSHFINIAKQILLVIIHKMVTGDNRITRGLKAGTENDYGEDGENIAEEPHVQRTVRTQSSTISKKRAV